MNPIPELIDQKIISYIDRISRAMRKISQHAGFNEGLNPLQIQILQFLGHGKNRQATVGFIAVEMEVTEATVSDSLKTLAARGLVKKVQDKSDKRVRHIYATAAGLHLYSKLVRSTHMPLNTMTDKDKEALAVQLQTLTYSLFVSRQLSQARICFTCHYHKPSELNTNVSYCDLLKKALYPADLQYDCPEHEYAASRT